MSVLICPVCKKSLLREDKIYKCENSHCFDISKYGVVNLHITQASSKKRHGDDSLMITARRDFLDKGYYSVLRDEICDMLKSQLPDNAVILDTGCGECYYTEKIAECSKESKIFGIDISKQALRYGKKRMNEAVLAVASIFDMPIENNIIDLVVNMFAPWSSEEFSRVLKNNGLLLRVFPLKNHLYGLKEKIYENVKLNKIDNIELENFEIFEKKEIKHKITLGSNQDIMNLFKMTPYYYKTSISDQKKLDNLNKLTTNIEFLAVLYRKIK